MTIVTIVIFKVALQFPLLTIFYSCKFYYNFSFHPHSFFLFSPTLSLLSFQNASNDIKKCSHIEENIKGS